MTQLATRQLGAGVIGLGVGEQHAIGFHHAEQCSIVGLCDYSEEKLASVSRRYPHAKSTTQWEELLSNEEVDVVSIASFDDAHFDQTKAAIAAGKHVFVEKPLCRSQAELRAIKLSLQARKSLQLSSNLVLRAAPIYGWLRDAIRNGELGEIYALDGEYLFGRIHKITQGWRKDVHDYSVMQGGGVHLADLMLWLTEQRPGSVASAGNRICTRNSAFRYHDFVTSTFTFPAGLIGRITANFGCVHRHQHVLRVFGTKATFVLDDQGPRLYTSRDPDQAPKRLEIATLPTAKWDLIPDFVHDILNGTGSGRAQQEFDTISVCLAADEALAAERQMEIEYV